jgi:tetraacyldisaccharide 4'-kinase
LNFQFPASPYAFVAHLRRVRYERDPARRRRLHRPVVSVGNLTVGGSGKTPAVGHIARLLLSMGERPAILTRGYRRPVRSDGVVVVSDGERIRADYRHAGDEPLMLAKWLPGVAVLACPDRYLAGTLAERRFGRSVHLLDDGFQHVQLHRDLDIVLIAPEDLDAGTLPFGRRRESLDALSRADVLIVNAADDAEARALGDRVGVATVFRARAAIASRLSVDTPDLVRPASRRSADAPDLVGPASRRSADAPDPVGPASRRLADAPDMVAPASRRWGASGGAGSDVAQDFSSVLSGRRVLAVAGIARPRRFFDALVAAGWDVAREIAYRDHHRFTRADVDRLAREAREASAALVLTTEKDLIRLLPFRPFPIEIVAVPLEFSIEPALPFREWLRTRLAAVRARG